MLQSDGFVAVLAAVRWLSLHPVLLPYQVAHHDGMERLDTTFDMLAD